MPSVYLDVNKECLLDAYRTLAELAKYNGQPEEALYWCNEWLKVDDTFRPPYLVAADIYTDLGNLDQAAHILDLMDEKAYRHYSWVEKQADWLYYDKLIRIFILIGREQYTEALPLIDEVLTYIPNEISLLQSKIICLQNLIPNNENQS